MLILLVCFVVVMLIWLLLMLGTIGPAPTPSPGPQMWLAWFASLILGVTFFLYGYGVVTVVSSTSTVR